MKRILFIILYLCIFAIVATSCGQSEQTPVASSTPTANQVIKGVTVQESYKLIQENKSNPNFVIIDVRTPGEVAEGHVENAVNIDFNSVTSQQDVDKLNKNKTYLVYCRTGRRSQSATELMEKAGFKKIYNMLDGISQWQAQGFPIIK